MVATVMPLRSSAQAVSYYEKDGYYAKDDPEHRDASFWQGKAARDTGLRGHVLPGEFEDVLDGWVPGTEIRLGRMREGEHDHRPGWDITFSAPKSVSLEGLVVGDRRVIRAHDDAVRATLEWIETDLLQTRGWDPITRQRPRVAADGMIVAGFRHLSSRGGDPQLHTHCVLANMTRNASGEWRSVEPTMIRRSEKLIGAYYRNELARRLQSLGMAVTPTLIGRVPGFELAGYDRAFLDAFSGQRAKILAYLEEHGLAYNARNTQIAALETRPAKQEIGLSQLVPQWRARAREMGLVRDKAALRPARPVDSATGRQVPPVEVPPPDLPANELRSLRRAPKLPPLPRDRELKALGAVHAPAGETAVALSPVPETGVLEAVARAVEHVAERRTFIPAAEIRAVALGHAPGRYRLADIDEAIERLAASGALIAVERKGMDRAFVTREAVRAEKKILAFMRHGRGRGKALGNAETVEERLEESRLTRGQKEAVRTVLLSDDMIVGVQGHAGSGKTTMLREVKELLGGTTIHGLAPSAAAARVLGSEAGIPSTTLQWFLTRFGDSTCAEGPDEVRESYRGAVLAVDECSMIDTVRMRELLRIARDLGVARIALVGDTAQLRAVDAGQPFRLLQKAGMKTATMDEVLRQEDPELREAVLRARHGEPGESIRGLRADRVREVPRDELGEEAARCWLALTPEERADTAVMAPTHEIRRQTNEAIREGLAEEGTLRGRVLEIDRLVNRHLTRALAAEMASYEPGDTVVFHRDAYGCRANDVCTVTEKRDGRVILAHTDGGERSFRPAGNAKNYLGLFDTERIELRAGDRIRWTRNRKAPKPRSGGTPPMPDLVNGGEAEIVEIGHRRVRFRDDEREFSLSRADPQLRHLDHAYCTTVHAAQGKTAGGAIAILDAGGATDQAMFHVEISRVRRAFLLLTDDREALIELLESRAGGEEGALEALGIDPSAMPSEDAEMFTALERDWRALERRAAETDTVVFFLPGYREVMARAAALAAAGGLPADLSRLVERMLAEHRRHLAHDREVRDLVRRIQEHGRRWPELGWAAETQGVDETAGHAAWREDAAALVDAGHGRLAAPGAERLHLEAMPGVGLAGALAELERTRLLDDARRFERLWHDHRERAAGNGIPELLAEGYAEVAALGERIGAADGLDARTREALVDWRAVHAEQTALPEAHAARPGLPEAARPEIESRPPHDAEAARLRGEIRDWPGRARILLDDRPPADAALDALTQWRERAEPLLQESLAMRAPDGPHAPHLEAMPRDREALDRASRRLDAAVCRVEMAETRQLMRSGQAFVEETGGMAYDAPTHGPLMERVRTLDVRDDLREAWRKTVDTLLAYDERLGRDRIGAFLDAAREVEEARDDLEAEARLRSMPAERLPGWEALRKNEQRVLNNANAIRETIPEERVAVHLASFGAGPDGIGEREEKIRERIARDADAHPVSFGAGPDGQEDREREARERIARDEQARAAAEAERRAGEQRRAAELERMIDEVRMAFERVRAEGKEADDRREPGVGKERGTPSGQYDPRESARAGKEAGKLANRLDACVERRDALLERAERKLYSNRPVVDLGREHKRWRRQADRAVEAGRKLLDDGRYASHLDGLGGRAKIEAAVDRLEKAAVLDHLPHRIVAGWEKLEDRVRETGAHRYFLPEHGRLCEAVDLLYPRDDVAHRFANGEMALRKDMTLRAEELDLTAKRLEECARERGRAEAGDVPFVQQEGYAEWRFRAELAVGRARGILSERKEYAPHFERDPKRAKTLETLSAGLDRTLRNEGAEWDRIRNERAERERHQNLDRSQDQGFSW